MIKVIYEGFEKHVWAFWDKTNNDGKFVLNGVYENAFINFDTSDSSSYKFPIYYGYENVSENEIEYIAQTDEYGQFYMPSIIIPDYERGVYDSLGIVTEYQRFSEYFKIWVVKDGMDNFYLDSVRVGDCVVVIRP